ncbi:unnamed protein product, partial [Meganyctiphanes norvegica]
METSITEMVYVYLQVLELTIIVSNEGGGGWGSGGCGTAGNMINKNVSIFEDRKEGDFRHTNQSGSCHLVKNSASIEARVNELMNNKTTKMIGIGESNVSIIGGIRDQNEHFENLINTLASIEAEIHQKYYTPMEVSKTESYELCLSNKHHVIVLRHGIEDKLVTLFGLMQALVSFVADSDDVMRCIKAGDHMFVFLVKSPLILVAVSHSAASFPQLIMQLTYVHNQIVSVMTGSALTRMFEKRRNYDFRHMLGGSERLLDHLLKLLDSHPSFLLGAIQCLPLPASIRDTITQTIIQYCAKIKNLVFGLIIVRNQLVSLVRMKKFLLHPADLHLLFNLVHSTESLKSSENWMPICLPKFDPNGYLYGHVSYLSDDCEACLLLLTVDREQFFTLSEAKQKIVDYRRHRHALTGNNSHLHTAAQYSIYFMAKSFFLHRSVNQVYTISPAYNKRYHFLINLKRIVEYYYGPYNRGDNVRGQIYMIFTLMEN